MKKRNNTPNYRNYLNLDALLNAQKLINKKIGAEGSVRAQYLKKALIKYRVFEDFSSLTTFLILRSDLPNLPNSILRNLSFHYDI